MRKLLIIAALALAFALPMTANPTTATAAEIWFKVNNPGYWVDIYSEPGYRKGRLKCRIPHGDFVEGARNLGQSSFKRVNGKIYYHVYWKRRLGTMEWHWRDGMNGRWCPHWNRNGWAEGNLLQEVRRPGGHWIN